METSGNGYVARGEGTPVVMLPGMEGAKEFWQFQVEGLSDRYRVVACDHARRSPSLSSTVEDYAQHVLGIMDELEIEKAIVVGESFGGMVSQQLATAHQDRLLGLVLCNTMDANLTNRWGFGFNMFTLATLVHQFAFLPFFSHSQQMRILKWVGKHRGMVMDPSPGNVDLSEYILRYGTACGPLAYLDRVIAGNKIRFTDKLGTVRVPALIIRGTEDRLVAPMAILELAGRIPGAEIAFIEGGGHCCQHTRPDLTNQALGEWLERKGL